MALTRKMLKAMGIEEEKIEQIIDAHSETVDALKSENTTLEEKANNVQKELDTLKSSKGEDWKEKYDNVKREFDDYKTAQSERETLSKKKSEYKKIIEQTGIKSEKLVNLIMNAVDFSKVELDGESLKNAEALTESIKNDYSDFVTSTTVTGTPIEKPVKNNTSVDLGKLEMKDYIEARKKGMT